MILLQKQWEFILKMLAAKSTFRTNHLFLYCFVTYVYLYSYKLLSHLIITFLVGLSHTNVS